MGTTDTSRRISDSRPRRRDHHLAASLAGTIAVLYGLLFAGALTIEGATEAELGVLGVAAMVFVALTGLLCWRRSRMLWAAAAALQLLLGWMYVAIAPERDPAFELWGVTIRAVSFALLVVLIRLLLTERRERRASPT